MSLSEIRRRSALEVEPFVVQVGVLRAVTGWIDETLAHHHARREFELRQGHGDKTVVRHAHVGLLTEVGFPLLDRRSSGQAFLKLKVQPERITVERKSTPRRNAPPVVPLSGSSFRFSIDGVLDGTEVQRVEAVERDLTFQIDTLQLQLDLKNEQHGRDMVEASGQLEGAITALKHLSNDLVRTLDEAIGIVAGGPPRQPQ